MSGLTQERLKEVLNYNPETGEFTWKRKTSLNTWLIGKPAGNRTSGSPTYIKIKVDRTLHLAHRLAFLYMLGGFPHDEVDHANGVGTDNRWANLRSTDHSTNLKNQALRSDSTTGVCGVRYRAQSGKYQVQVGVSGRLIYGGAFDTLEAASAKAAALRDAHGFARHHGLTREARLLIDLTC